jgi:hypothetical protein
MQNCDSFSKNDQIRPWKRTISLHTYFYFIRGSVCLPYHVPSFSLHDHLRSDHTCLCGSKHGAFQIVVTCMTCSRQLLVFASILHLSFPPGPTCLGTEHMHSFFTCVRIHTTCVISAQTHSFLPCVSNQNIIP